MLDWSFLGIILTSICHKAVPLSGGTMTGVLDMGSNRITNLANPSSPSSNDAVSASWVSTLVGTTASTLDDLLDTNLSPTLINRSVLVYDAGTGMWRDDFLAVNDLSGIIATTVEVNYLSGVTGALQTGKTTLIKKYFLNLTISLSKILN